MIKMKLATTHTHTHTHTHYSWLSYVLDQTRILHLNLAYESLHTDDAVTWGTLIVYGLPSLDRPDLLHSYILKANCDIDYDWKHFFALNFIGVLFCHWHFHMRWLSSLNWYIVHMLTYVNTKLICLYIKMNMRFTVNPMLSSTGKGLFHGLFWRLLAASALSWIIIS